MEEIINFCLHSLFEDFYCCFQTVEFPLAGNCVHEITVFVLACFIGYYAIWKVTPALHAPLMSVTNVISSVIIIGAIFATTQYSCKSYRIIGFIAIMLTAINIFGGFTITHRMLNMFHKK